MTNFYSNMYGNKAKEKADQLVQKPNITTTVPAASKRLRGLKLTNSHMHEIDINGEIATIPSAAYVKLLEDQIKESRKEMILLKDEMQKMRSNMNHLVKELNKVHTRLDNTVTIRGGKNK